MVSVAALAMVRRGTRKRCRGSSDEEEVDEPDSDSTRRRKVPRTNPKVVQKKKPSEKSKPSKKLSPRHKKPLPKPKVCIFVTLLYGYISVIAILASYI